MSLLRLFLPLRCLLAREHRIRSPRLRNGRRHAPRCLGLEDRTVPSTLSAQAYGQLPLSFETNLGQADPGVDFLSRGSGYTVFLSPAAAILGLGQQSSPAAESSPTDPAQAPTVVCMDVVGASATAAALALDRQTSVSNYLVGNDPSRWHTNVPNYGRIQFQDVYPGVDLVYYGNQGRLEYDFTVASGVDPTIVRVEFHGIVGMSLDDAGNLLLHTTGGDLLEQAPIVYQTVNGARQPVVGRYLLEAHGQVGFQVGAYDHAEPLTIDPVLSYSTYLGGINNDVANAIAVDSAGNAYITGYTQSANWPTANALQGIPGGGGEDAFVAKLNAAGTALVYSTYLGGSGTDAGSGIVVDSSGDAYIAGYTNSTNFPTANAIQATNGGGYDAFLTKLNAAGSALVYSTYLGDTGMDEAHAIAVDSAGEAVVTGFTFSANFPTANALQSTNAGNDDVFVSKLNAAGTALVYSTYLGGSGFDVSYGIAVDSAGNAYVAGYTTSTNFPTANAFQSTSPSGGNAFVTKINAAGIALVYSTYLGGTIGFDWASAIAVDGAGNAYVTGYTTSTNFPIANAFQSSNAGGFDAFVTKFDPTGTALVYSTYLGGSGDDQADAIAVDSSGDVFVTGYTASPNFPLAGALQTSNGGNWDVFVTAFAPTGTSVTFSTYLGGTGYDQGYGIAVDNNGGVYIAGYTTSTNFPTVNPIQASNAGGDDVVISKITIGNNNPVPAITSLSSTSTAEGSAQFTLTVTGSNFIASSVVDWNGTALSTTYVSGTEVQALAPASDLADESSDSITVVNPAPGGGTSNAETFAVTAAAPTAGISDPTDGYQGVQGQTRTFTLTATSSSGTDQVAGFTYTVQWGDGQSTTTPAGQSGSGINLSHVYAAAGSYTVSVTATDDGGQVSVPATLTDNVLVVEQQGNGLAIGGAATLSTWTFTPGSTAGTLTVKLGSKTLGTFTATAGVVVYGQAGLNKLTINGTSGNDAFSVNDASATLNAFTFSGTSIGGWTFNGLGGNNTLTVVATLKADPVTFNGGTGGSNTLFGPNVPATWTLSKADGGSLATVPATGAVSFSGVQNLVGGTAADDFKFTKTTAVFATIVGGGGGDWLDYAAFPTTVSVRVDLTQGSATNVDGEAAGGIQGIQNVRGGQGNDTLSGNGGNILIGGSSSNVLTDAYTGSAASGRSLLIGGLGSSNLTAGGAGDILIAGTTNYNTNNTALAKILAEWQSSDSYQQRFDSLQGLKGSGTGSHLNGTYDLIWGKTVTDNDAASVLMGGGSGAGLDWFFANYPSGNDTINNFDAPGDEYLNNSV